MREMPSVGKVVGNRLYVHRIALERLPAEHRALLDAASKLAQAALEHADVFCRRRFNIGQVYRLNFDQGR
jgi:hypothetical protein